jgi:hypothetical protein
VRLARWLVIGGAAGGGLAVYRLVVAGALTIDVGIGRRERPLGPIRRVISAPRDVVFDVIAGPYLHKTPRAMHDKLTVLERGSDMVLAAHHTEIGKGRKATTLETVRFDRPERVHFRLVRGPVPEVVETFELLEGQDRQTTFTYSGTLSTDWGSLGARWGELVARKWEAAVHASLDSIAVEAERRASKAPRHVMPRP